MSTKFSIRPAPRKRPWLCKRSPPCLVPPPIPPNVLCTFSIKKMQPLPTSATWSATFTLLWVPLMPGYSGTFTESVNFYTIDFFWSPTTNIASVLSNTNFTGLVDAWTYPTKTIPGPPKLSYEAFDGDTLFYQWKDQVTITG